MLGTLKALGALLASAAAAFALVGGVAHVADAGPALHPVVSDNVSLLPARWSVIADPLPLSEMPVVTQGANSGSLRVSPDQALTAAQREFNVPDAAIDQHIGVVRAKISLRGSEVHRDQKVYIVTADAVTHWPIGQGQTRSYSKLCIVVDATTGRYEFAYPADVATSD